MFHRPSTLTEALELKSRLKDKGVFLAGGTDLVVGVAKGRLAVEHWIDLSGVPGLSYVREEREELAIGPLATHAMLERSAFAPALAQAARTVGGPAIRNRGTIAGNLGTASPAGDVSVALLALDATLTLVRSQGSRAVPIRDFFVGPGKTRIAPDEMIQEVRIRRPADSAFLKLGKRQSVAIALVSAAAVRQSDGRVAIALGSVAPVPLRAAQTEAHLAIAGLAPDAIREAAGLVSAEVKPIDDHRASADYRRALSGVLVRRLLEQLAAASSNHESAAPV